MEKITKEDFGKWAKQNHWLKVNVMDTPQGHQVTYLTPCGGLRAAIYNLQGEFYQVASLGPPEPQGQTINFGSMKGFPPIVGKG